LNLTSADDGAGWVAFIHRRLPGDVLIVAAWSRPRSAERSNSGIEATGSSSSTPAPPPSTVLLGHQLFEPVKMREVVSVGGSSAIASEARRMSTGPTAAHVHRTMFVTTVIAASTFLPGCLGQEP
jgi:hypothetical protein